MSSDLSPIDALAGPRGRSSLRCILGLILGLTKYGSGTPA